VALWLLLTYGLCGCATPSVKADAKADVQIASGAGSQAGSNAGVKLRSGAVHVKVGVTPSLDGGAPTFTLGVDADPDEASGEASGEADAGSDLATDAGSAGGASAPQWTFPWLKIALVAGAAVGVFALWKLRAKIL
jgi:hypothetical protein